MSRTTLSRIAIGATAALASIVPTASAAIAEDDLAPDSVEVVPDTTTSPDPAPESPEPESVPDPSPPVDEPVVEEPVVEEPLPTLRTDPFADEPFVSMAAEEIEPAYGVRKYYIGIQRGDGAWVPPGSTTAGSTFSIETTHLDGSTSTDSCTTAVYTPNDDDLSTCSPAGYETEPGDRVVITQTGAGPGYRSTGAVTVVEPCTTEADAEVPCTPIDFTLESPGPLPEAPAQSETIEPGESVTMDPVGELAAPFDPETAVVSVDTPSFGTAAIVDGKIVYTANENAGDSAEVFTYTMENSNGTTTGTVDITIEAAEVLEPNYGTRKYYVDVDQGTPSWVSPGSTTAGSTFSIVLTHPDGSTSTDSCTSGTTPIDPFGVSSTCDFPLGLEAGEGDDIAITQTGAGPGFVSEGETKYIEACTDEEVVGGTCEDDGVTFENKGFKPVAVADPSATTPAGTPVTIDVLANDTSADPTTLELDVVSDPADGTAVPVGSPNLTSPSPFPFAASSDRATAQVVPAQGTYAIRYTPDPGFSGTDTFGYTVENSNGTSERATVTVQVVGADPVDPDGGGDGTDPEGEGTPRASTPTRTNLPDTGAPTGRLLGLGALMVTVGGALLTRRRREETVRD